MRSAFDVGRRGEAREKINAPQVTIAFATELDSVDLRFRFMVIAHFRLRRFRVTAVDKKTGDLLAYETNDRERAKLKLAEFEGRPDLIGAESETQRWV